MSNIFIDKDDNKEFLSNLQAGDLFLEPHGMLCQRVDDIMTAYNTIVNAVCWEDGKLLCLGDDTLVTVIHSVNVKVKY